MLTGRGIFFGKLNYCHFSFCCHAFKPSSIIYYPTLSITKVSLFNRVQISVSFLLSYCGSAAKPMRMSVILSAELCVNGLQEESVKSRWITRIRQNTKYLPVKWALHIFVHWMRQDSWNKRRWICVIKFSSIMYMLSNWECEVFLDLWNKHVS